MKALLAFLNVCKVKKNGTRAMPIDTILVILLSFCNFAFYRFVVLSFVVFVCHIYIVLSFCSLCLLALNTLSSTLGTLIECFHNIILIRY